MLPNKTLDFFKRNLIISGIELVNSEAFLILEKEDFFFDSVFADEAENKDVVLLAYAMSATHGLVFDGWIPPVVEEDDTVGRGEVEAKTACLQTNQEYGNAIVRLEQSHRRGAIKGVTIEGDKANALLMQEMLHLG